MKRVEVMPGPCGFVTQIVAEAQEDGKIEVEILSDCQLISQYADKVVVVDPIQAVQPRTATRLDPLITGAPCHPGCLVPLATLKAVEAEAGFALPQDATIRFLDQG